MSEFFHLQWVLYAIFMLQCGEHGFVFSVGVKAFTGQISLKRHMTLRSGEEHFHCHWGDSVTLKRDLKTHTERLHAVKQ